MSLRPRLRFAHSSARRTDPRRIAGRLTTWQGPLLSRLAMVAGMALVMLASFGAAAFAATYTWNQTGTASWAIATNWTPTRTAPLTSDILLFNNGATTTATTVPTQTISQLIISGSTNVTLQGAV